MDKVSQERFDTLRKTDQANWTEADFAFMVARRGYLPEAEIKVLGLEPALPPADSPAPSKGKKNAAE